MLICQHRWLSASSLHACAVPTTPFPGLHRRAGHVTRTAPTGDFDEEAGWDVPGAHSLHTLPKDPIGSVDDVTGGPPGLDAKVVL
jgi:hypothetical protein